MSRVIEIGEYWLRMSTQESSGVLEMFYILSWVVITQVHLYAKIHQDLCILLYVCML